MTKKLSYTRLSKSRFIGLEHFSRSSLTASELGALMWGAHRMALVNAKAVIRELLLGEFIRVAGGTPSFYVSTERAKPILKDPSWICKYCSLDTTDSNKRLWAYPCAGCETFHQACRSCKRHVLKVTGDFPYTVKARACPGQVEIPKRPEKKPTPSKMKPAPTAPALAQADLYEREK